MKFESKFGLEEIVHYCEHGRQSEHKKSVKHDVFLKVVSVVFTIDGAVNYVCRWPNGNIGHFAENELIGDPDFNQESGYPDEEEY